MFIVFGVLFIIWSREYQFGTSQRMGPGYFPTVLGVLLVLLGLLVGLPAMRARAEETHVESVGWRGLIVVLAGVALYAYLLPRLGFVISLTVLLVISSMAHREYTWRAILLSVLVLGIGSYLVFVKGLELQFSVWPPFLTR